MNGPGQSQTGYNQASPAQAAEPLPTIVNGIVRTEDGVRRIWELESRLGKLLAMTLPRVQALAPGTPATPSPPQESLVLRLREAGNNGHRALAAVEALVGQLEIALLG